MTHQLNTIVLIHLSTTFQHHFLFIRFLINIQAIRVFERCYLSTDPVIYEGQDYVKQIEN